VTTLATPAWLLGLLFVPVVWYLHRSGPVLRRHPVANLELWQDDRARAVQAGQRRPADPAWLRRAAILSLLCLALAGPQWQRPNERVTLWIDDSLSMQTLEQGETRLDRGLRLAQAALRDSAVHDVIVRPLSEPMRAYSSAGATTMQAIESHAGAREPQFPAPDAFDPDRAHWLVTDGADAEVNAWLGNSPVDRVIQVASAARNVGIARVTVRPQPGDARTGALQIRLRNGGSAPETRTVEVTEGAVTLAARAVSIDAGESVTLDQVVPLPLQRLTVRLTPADALPQDDRAIVDGAPLSSIAVHVDPACPIEVTRAVGAHPALRLTHAVPPGLVVDCGSGWEHDRAVPRLVLRQGPPAELDASAVTWSQATAGMLPAVAGFPPRTRGTLDAPRPVDDVLVAAGDVPLVIRRAGAPRIVESTFDLGAAESQGTETVPLLFAFLADVALDMQLLDRSAALVRDDDASMIARRADLGKQSRPSRRAQGGGTPFGLAFVGLAVLLVAWDVLALARRWLRDYGPRARIVA
jgi:hypothetical protein